MEQRAKTQNEQDGGCEHIGRRNVCKVSSEQNVENDGQTKENARVGDGCKGKLIEEIPFI